LKLRGRLFQSSKINKNLVSTRLVTSPPTEMCDTIDTVPPVTLDAVPAMAPSARHRRVRCRCSRHVLAVVEEHGIGLDDIMDKLVVDGVKRFSDAFDKLLAGIEGSAPQAGRITVRASPDLE
jgi:hypothetical protein